jgi:hypothetical protein
MAFLVDLVIKFHFQANLVTKIVVIKVVIVAALPVTCLFYDAISSTKSSKTNLGPTCNHYFKIECSKST